VIKFCILQMTLTVCTSSGCYWCVVVYWTRRRRSFGDSVFQLWWLRNIAHCLSTAASRKIVSSI